ncbi:MAG: hypothetical protein V9G16_08710 [Nitrosomonas sp.]
MRLEILEGLCVAIDQQSVQIISGTYETIAVRIEKAKYREDFATNMHNGANAALGKFGESLFPQIINRLGAIAQAITQ